MKHDYKIKSGFEINFNTGCWEVASWVGEVFKVICYQGIKDEVNTFKSMSESEYQLKAGLEPQHHWTQGCNVHRTGSKETKIAAFV